MNLSPSIYRLPITAPLSRTSASHHIITVDPNPTILIKSHQMALIHSAENERARSIQRSSRILVKRSSSHLFPRPSLRLFIAHTRGLKRRNACLFRSLRTDDAFHEELIVIPTQISPRPIAQTKVTGN
ncbi:hypothetical protein L195_g046746 [Trifolium pratense]|uniref:Uncharacterized protein n=1 Tax=Trifolium pratense TaxID=57577 RepID=A0A2K3MIL3_TRIPR|nr:hypothetical protein L195_g046746 [Trifolium pratense]